MMEHPRNPRTARRLLLVLGLASALIAAAANVDRGLAEEGTNAAVADGTTDSGVVLVKNNGTTRLRPATCTLGSCTRVAALADTTGPTYASAQTFVVRGEYELRAGPSFRCWGMCRSAASDGTHVRLFRVPVIPASGQLTFETAGTRVGCFQALDADCTDAAAAAASDQ